MERELKYKIIKNARQYDKYCKILEELVFENGIKDEDEIELVTLLIEKWDDENYQMPEIDPIQLFKIINGGP